ncbi:putative P-loop containing nucleoside triphosphate hydrolase, leucine-rich repeat domain superfamily [Helianthus debilis subsp. tardiflorus]
MAVAELFLTPFITVLFDKLASADLISLARSAGLYSQINKWKKTLSQIQSVLADAGQKQIREKAVQLWLHDLQDLAYEIDDVLDDLATEGMRRKLNQEVDSSKETSLVDESEIVGRDGDKQALLGMLLGNETCKRNVSVLSIVGLGGIGKTTLAQVLYNDKKVKDHFELMAWVCVSDEFDVFNISKAIYQAVVGNNCNFANLNLLQEALAQKLLKKRFLFVLDDVWNENYKEWQLLQRPFVTGATGSKIIVTTRKTSVASMMDPVHAHYLDVLSNEEALSLFAQHALGEQNFDKHPSLKLHGEGIVKKCDGLPLALIMLGRVSRTKTNDEDWEELLNSEIWNLRTENEILLSLRISYYDLPPQLKQVFAYCSLFSKDYVFDKDELILLWMAEGFLYEINGNKTMEQLGDEYFEELKCRCFFQHSTTEKSRYKMHDLINDLATSVAKEFFFRFDEKMEVYEGNEALEKSRYVSLIHEKNYGLYRKFMAFQRARQMRTFLSIHVCANRLPYLFLSTKVVIDLLPRLQFLRVVSLTNRSITEIPQSIGSLKHIRYLNFSGTYITCLPEQVSDLYNLQSLLVCDCFQLSRLPKSFVKLINLRHLDINGTPLLNKIPEGIGSLSSLRTLSKVIIERANGFKITELKGLSHLRGRLSIVGLHKVINAIHARDANLWQKTGLDDLVMEWSDVFNHSRNELTEFEVLEALRPHRRLRTLKICFYKGSKFPNWVGDPTFVRLTQLTLQGCRGCRYLPTLGHLSSLQKLFVKSMNGVKTLGCEFLGPDSYDGFAFPSLEILEIDDMQDWEIWSTNCGDGKRVVGSFPCLRELSIQNCPKLATISIGLIPSLQVLDIQGCCEAVFNSMVCVSSSILRLTMGYINGLTRLHGEVLRHLGGIEYLCIRWCNELSYLWELETQACNIFVSLQILRIESCEKLVSLGNKDANMESIRKVYLRSCQRLESYNCPKSIEKLAIFDCPSITSLTFPTAGSIPSSMKILDISGCDNLEESWLFHNFLSTLFIRRLPNLRAFPEGCLHHLTNLTISNCDILESICEEAFGHFPILRIRCLHIIDCKNLKSFPYDQLRNTTSLEELSIRSCPSLDYSFPCGLWPPNLISLAIGGLKKPMSKWGLQNFPTSLVRLHLHGENSGVVSFASWSFILPASLTFLQIRGFMDLESFSEALQHLTCIKQLHIASCPKLRDLPETLLPLLSSLSVKFCGKLQKKCNRKGNYWSIISQIPFLDV